MEKIIKQIRQLINEIKEKEDVNINCIDVSWYDLPSIGSRNSVISDIKIEISKHY